jgi:hypothetical protein
MSRSSHGSGQQWKVVSNALILRKSLSPSRMHDEPRSVVVAIPHLHLDRPLVLLRKSLHKLLDLCLREALVRHSLCAACLTLNTHDDSNPTQQLAARHNLARSIDQGVQLDQRPLSQHQTQLPNVLPAPRKLEHPIAPDQRGRHREAGTPQYLVGSRLGGLSGGADKPCGLASDQEGA